MTHYSPKYIEKYQWILNPNEDAQGEILWESAWMTEADITEAFKASYDFDISRGAPELYLLIKNKETLKVTKDVIIDAYHTAGCEFCQGK